MNFEPKYKILKYNLRFWILFLKYYFSHTTFLYSSARSSGHDQYFFLISDFLAESLKVKSKTSEKDHSFYNTVSLKKPHSCDEPHAQWYWK